MPNYFYLKDGRIIKTIEELPTILKTTSDNVFYEHVTPYKNDFAKWIYDEFKNADLSNLIGALKSKEEIIRTIIAYLKIQETKKNETKIIKNEISNDPQIKKAELNEKKENQNNSENENLSLIDRAKELLKDDSEKDQKKENNSDATKNEQIKNEAKKNFGQEDISPDEFFRKNPVIIEHVVEAKKQNLVLEPLSFIDFDKNNPQKSIEIFKDNYAKSYQRMSFLRKSGFDTSLAEMMLFRVLPKIRLYESSNEEKDALIVKRFLNEAIEEINNLK